MRHIQVVRADVLAAGRVVVINDGDAFFRVGLGGQGVPAGHAGGQTVDFGRQGDRRTQAEAGARIGPYRAECGDHDGLSDALQFRQGDPILHRIGG